MTGAQCSLNETGSEYEKILWHHPSMKLSEQTVLS